MCAHGGSEDDEDLLSLGWTDLSSYSWSQSDSDSDLQVPSLQKDIMSRRSLRLDDTVLHRGLSSASYSAGGGSRRSSRSLKLRSPRPPSSSSELPSVHSDASLLSSLLDTSSVQEVTMVDSFWESTMMEDQTSIVGDISLTGSGDGGSKLSLSRVYCKDCELESDQREAGDAYSSSKYTSCSSSSVFTPSETQTSTIYCRDRSRRDRTARPGRCGAMKESNSTEIHPSGALYGDCQENKQTETNTVTSSSSSSPSSSPSSSSSSWSSVAVFLLGLMCSAAIFTGRTAAEAFRLFHQRWNHTTTDLHRFPLRLVVFLLLLLLIIFSLCWFGPAGLQSVLLAFRTSEWRTAVVPQSQSEEGAVESREVQVYEEPLTGRPLEDQTPTGPEDSENLDLVDLEVVDLEDMNSEDVDVQVMDSEDSERLGRLEQRLAALWQRVEAGGRRAEQRHQEVLQLHHHLHHPQQQQSDVESWINVLMEQQLSQLNTRLDEERVQREQVRLQDLLQQESQTSRLDRLELQLQTLVAKTQEVQWRQEAASASTLPAAVSVGVDRQSHDALLAEVSRLKAVLEDVRRDVEVLSSNQNDRQLAAVQQMVSSQLRSLVYGGDGGESLLQWMSQHYVSLADLQVALSSLQLSILNNISQQLEQRHGNQPVREGAMTTEDVQLLVQDALRLFSEDRTGLADYALESGGGSILSTRCSETYETKAALLSLFGLPLWYFSQSPRTVIQPDVHPGNCWAFRGSTGFLVIRLSMKILPSSFSLDHIPRSLAPSGTLLSAPRDFSVYGLEEESQENGKLLGTYRYDQDGEAVQTFSVSEENDEAFQIIEVRVLSNWGHQEYTCMYRFRVHGTPSVV
ncbi:SUN domain-containing protein 1-like isoform X2 [Acanthochromis polyacanthus]|uniref:SUN domain-containing protein 1-like isoform X2 n=1 Tax=Acanthochromis polyacanthus TaxID=80966 RepID=UPI00223457BD|nr:SUN domain-containing protein 1-like isoform X2 [Acanthochromis polyacanthus]